METVVFSNLHKMTRRNNEIIIDEAARNRSTEETHRFERTEAIFKRRIKFSGRCEKDMLALYGNVWYNEIRKVVMEWRLKDLRYTSRRRAMRI